MTKKPNQMLWIYQALVEYVTVYGGASILLSAAQAINFTHNLIFFVSLKVRNLVYRDFLAHLQILSQFQLLIPS
jgi:hypothetical protein